MTPSLPQDISDIPQQDAPVGAAPGGDQSQLLLNMLRQSGGRTVGDQSPLPPQNDPGSDLRAWIQQHTMQSRHDMLMEKLHMTDKEKEGRSKWGNAGQVAGNVLQALVGGRNFRTEANQDYDAQTTRLNEANQVVRNDDLAKQAKATLDVNAAYKQGVLANSVERTAATERRNQDLADIAREGNEIKSRIADGRLTLQEAQAYKAKVDATNKEHNGGLSGDDGVAYGLAQDVINGVPQDKINAKLRMLGIVKASNTLGKVISTGSDRTSSQSIDPVTGNTVTSSGTNRHFASPGSALWSQITGQQAQNPLAQFGTPGFAGGGAASVAAPGISPQAPTPHSADPINPIQHLQNNLPAPPADPYALAKPMDPQNFLKNHAGEVGGNIAMMKTLQDNDKKAFEAANKLYVAKGLAIEDTAKQRANLANAMINGSAENYQGLIPSLLEKARNIVGDVGANEALGRPFDYDALYGKLGASVKGTFKNVEINSATGTLGKRTFSPENSLFLHAANELAQEAQAAAVSKQLEDRTGKKLIGPEELTQVMANEISRYMVAVKKAQSAPPAARAALTPTLRPIPEIVGDYLTKKKIGIQKTATPNPSDKRAVALADLNN